MTETARLVDGSREPTEAQVADCIRKLNAAQWADLTRFIAANYPASSTSSGCLAERSTGGRCECGLGPRLRSVRGHLLLERDRRTRGGSEVVWREHPEGCRVMSRPSRQGVALQASGGSGQARCDYRQGPRRVPMPLANGRTVLAGARGDAVPWTRWRR